jgi:O-antigen/teichoic acid export membrane protein
MSNDPTPTPPVPGANLRLGLASAAATSLGRHALVYGSGAALPIVLGLVNIAALTRFIEPSAFGQLAVLLVFAASLTILYTLGILQGCFRTVFGGDGEEETDLGDRSVVTSDKRGALGTGIALIALIAASGTALIALIAESLTPLLFLNESQSHLVVLAAAGGGLGAVWRLVVNVPRLERRPGVYAALNGVRPTLVIALSITLVALGGGIEGVLVGIAVGTALAVTVGLAVSRRSMRPAFDRGHALSIMRSGTVVMPLVLSAWVVHNLDVYIVAGMASDADAGLYRVASRVASVVSLALGFFLMAWVPLRRTSLFRALEPGGSPSWFNATIATYFVVACVGLLVVLGVAAQFLVRIAGPAYGDAATLIPLIGLGLAAYGCFVMLMRVVKMPRKLGLFVGLAALSAVVFAIAALLLTPRLGVLGTAIAPAIGYAVGIAGALAFAARAHGLPAVRWWKIGVSALTGLACILLAAALSPDAGAPAVAFHLGAIALYPAAMLAFGVVEREHLAPLKRVARSLIGRLREPAGLGDRLAALPAAERALVESLLRRREPPSDVADRLSLEPAVLHERLTATLRRLAGRPDPCEHDTAIGAYLLSRAPVAERDSIARRLWSEDVDPADLHALEATATALATARAWQPHASPNARGHGPPPKASETTPKT